MNLLLWMLQVIGAPLCGTERPLNDPRTITTGAIVATDGSGSGLNRTLSTNLYWFDSIGVQRALS
jgi:hypothetical protein